ncbi:hypothetical protein [Streptomyces sp. YS-3]|uniref:hypothetical protein n=1 Tax=Streptomyces sp. YS-3 TaxID=3381352 RepID=UPI003862CFEC
MRPSQSRGLWRTGLTILSAVAGCALAATTATAAPSATAPGPSKPAAVAAGQPKLGDACTSADLGKRYPYIKSTQVVPTITHFKGWYVTEGSTGSQTIETSTQTVVTVQVGLSANIQGNFQVDVLAQVGGSLGLNVQMSSSTTSSESKSISWDFRRPGYYALYEGTRKVTGQYGSLNCNRVDTGNGTYATQWIDGPDSGSYTTYTTLEEGAVRCEDTVPASSIMRKAQDLLDCGSTAATAKHAAGPVPSAKADRAKHDTDTAVTAAQSMTPQPAKAAARAALNCQAAVYRIDVPGKPLNWSAPLLANDGVRLRESTFFSAHLDNWRLCNVTENNGVLEASLWNWGNGGCATIPANIANQEQAYLTTATCGEDDLQRFYIYRDVPGSSKIGLQNKYTGSMMSHDRYADGELIRQYSSGRQDGTGTYTLTGV